MISGLISVAKIASKSTIITIPIASQATGIRSPVLVAVQEPHLPRFKPAMLVKIP